MTAAAFVMMIVAIVTLWGGLAASAWNLFSRDDASKLDDTPYTPTT